MRLDPNAEQLVRAYRKLFYSLDGQTVLQDLMKYCGFRVAIGDQIGEGKRRVFLHILEHSQLSDDDIFALYQGRGLVIFPDKPIAQKEDTDG